MEHEEWDIVEHVHRREGVGYTQEKGGRVYTGERG